MADTDPAAPADGQTPPAPTSPPAPAPGYDRAEIEALIARKAQEMSDQRIAGLQRSFDKRLNDSLKALERKLRPESETDEDHSEYEARLADLERQNAELRALSAYDPRIREAYQRVFESGTVEDRIAAFAALLSPSETPAPAEATPPVAPTPPVDRNNPIRQPADIAVDFDKLSDADLDTILRGGRWGG